MAYSDKAAWEYLSAAFEQKNSFVEIYVLGRDEPVRATGLLAFDDEGFVEVRLDRSRTVVIRADHIVTIMAA